MLKQLAVSWLSCFSAVLSAQPVTWLYTDWPPHHILAGDYAGQGTFDQIQQRLMAALPQFEHQTRLVSFGRIEPLFAQQQDTYCITGTLYSHEREAQRYFSLPMAIGTGYYISYLADSALARALDNATAVDLASLSGAGPWLGVYAPSRYYPDVVRQVLQQHASQWLSVDFTSSINPLALLQSGRADYVLEYPERIEFYNQSLSQRVAVKSIAINGAASYSVSHVACNKTVLGQQVVAAIDEVLQQQWQQQSYADLIFYWLAADVKAMLMPKFREIQQQVAEKNRL